MVDEARPDAAIPAGGPRPESRATLAAVREIARGRLLELLAPGGGSPVEDLLEEDREHRHTHATHSATASSPDRKSASAALTASTAALGRRLATLQASPGTVRHFLVDTADGIFTDGITTHGGITLVQIHAGPTPENNWARFDLDVEFHGSHFLSGNRTLTFDFLWRNESARPVSADVHGYLVLDGTGVTLCDGGWIVFTGATLDLIPSMTLLDLSTSPPTQLPAQDGDSIQALHLHCEASGILETGGIDGRDIVGGFDLQHVGAVVPAGGELRVRLALVMSFSIVRDGEVQASFATGPRRVLTPGILIAATDL